MSKLSKLKQSLINHFGLILGALQVLPLNENFTSLFQMNLQWKTEP